MGFKFQSKLGSKRPVIHNCKSGTQAAQLRNWQSRFRYGTLCAINGQFIDTIDDAQIIISKLNDSKKQECKVTITHPEIAQPLTASGIPQLHFDQLHAIAHHLHILKYCTDACAHQTVDSSDSSD
jgi:hypothetical protein